jgi:hypothetical protein
MTAPSAPRVEPSAVPPSAAQPSAQAAPTAADTDVEIDIAPPRSAGAMPLPARTPSPRRPVPSPARPTAVESLDPLAELELIEQAHGQLASAPAQALTATERHARRFPTGQFAQERELIAIEALIALGHAERARARGERFLARYPRSSHGRKVRALIAQRATAPTMATAAAQPAAAPNTAAQPAPPAAVAPAAAAHPDPVGEP